MVGGGIMAATAGASGTVMGCRYVLAGPETGRLWNPTMCKFLFAKNSSLF